MRLFDGDTFEHRGRTFCVHIRDDDNQDAPWLREDGHGPVREVRGTPRTCGKRPGERVMGSDRGTVWLYDWQAAAKQARAEGWNAKPFDAPGRINRAVQADFDFLRRFVDNQWGYVGVCVRLADDETPNAEYAHALWGIDSDSSDYIVEVAHELADEIADELDAADRAALGVAELALSEEG